MTSASPKRIIVTGGSGKVGRSIIARLLQDGYEVLNLDRVPLPQALSQTHTVQVDLCDSGQVFSALGSHFVLSEPFREPYRPADAIVHLGGIARNMIVPDNETFRANVVAGFNVMEAACRLGIKTVVLASSVCVYGVTYAEGDVDFPSFPVDERIAPQPMDPYSLSKLCMEQTAESFVRRFPGLDVHVLRIGAVIGPNEYNTTVFRRYLEEPEAWKVHGWSYIDARDLAEMCKSLSSSRGADPTPPVIHARLRSLVVPGISGLLARVAA